MPDCLHCRLHPAKAEYAFKYCGYHKGYYLREKISQIRKFYQDQEIQRQVRQRLEQEHQRQRVIEEQELQRQRDLQEQELQRQRDLQEQEKIKILQLNIDTIDISLKKTSEIMNVQFAKMSALMNNLKNNINESFPSIDQEDQGMEQEIVHTVESYFRDD